MSSPLKLMAVFAHPDDESLGMGSTLAKYAAEGIATSLVMATRGERGWTGAAQEYPGEAALGKIREGELMAAAGALGIGEVIFLDYIDGDLDQADPIEATAKIVAQIRRIRPHVVVTFGPDGAYGHPDHIAISQLTSAAVVAAADAGYLDGRAYPPHRVAKLYYMVDSRDLITRYEAVFGDMVMRIDGVERRSAGWDDWAITSWIDGDEHWQTAWRAVSCHSSQLPHKVLAKLTDEQHRRLWGQRMYYRAFSLVNGGRAPEDDLFVGLR